MVPAKQNRTHFAGWIILGLIVFLQPFGQVAADTKLDLLLNPAGFLGGALQAWTDNFTLGQLQNQAYGYLFPQGFFFLITDFLPDWIAQRLWWWLVLGLGFSGFLKLVAKLGIGTLPFQVIAAFLFALSPRTLTTLTAISSETWPIMLAPWVCLPLVARNITARTIALSLIPAACMGAVNATATMAALIPAALILLYRSLEGRRSIVALLLWGIGVVAVNAWWIGPLLILGRYAPPFTEFIESASVTTSWLNPVEILRGTTSWTPFVDTERQAGYLLVNDSLFVVLSVLVAAAGLSGLALMRARGLWVVMLACGLLILGSASVPAVVDFLDGPGAALRNIHKFDLLVRMPLMVGVAALGAHITLPTISPKRIGDLTTRSAAGLLVVLIAVGATAPAWSARLLPQGTWDDIPDYWYEATDFINDNAAGTRTLIWPSAHFARQDWGWTRDEPAQPLLTVPWAVRDAIPLVPPEAIRGLDGLKNALNDASLQRLGIGAVLVRHDLNESLVDEDIESLDLPGTKHTFGEVDVYLIDPDRNMLLTEDPLPTVAGGGEILSLLDTINGYSPRALVSGDAQIVTDTPQLVGTNYGDGSSSAALAGLEETEVKNKLVDYPSTGPLTRVIQEGSIRASSSGSDATSFGGSNPDRSLNSLLDNRHLTAWYPAPGDTSPWIEVEGTGTTLSISPRDDVTVTITSGDSVMVREIEKGRTSTFTLAQASARIEFDRFVGISELHLDGLSRTITVPETSPDVQQFLFQRLTVPTSYLDRSFTVPRDMTVTVDAQSCQALELDGEPFTCGPFELTAGQHMLRTQSEWVTFTESVPHASTTPVSSPESTIEASDSDRIFITTRAFNAGTSAQLDGVDLEPIELDASSQGFIIPAGLSGDVTFSFNGDTPYRISLFAGAGLSFGVVTLCVLVAARRRDVDNAAWQDTRNAPWAVFALVPMLGWWFIPAIATWGILRYTLIPRWVLGGLPLTICGLWLAQAPWPAAAYPGDSPAVALLAGISVAAIYAPGVFEWKTAERRTQSRAGFSTNV
ncbi:hypothetical protein CDES_12825 [Corynebacterium deserti GIMN1.010]|uniref:Alpha-(1->3)-arabinofuranosyltransferase N-terminal GT-C domain-containing protein n=1 Tax=Corynebacterium deserti GIMN1.010 TaxID=931089 RepID=A0A0M3QA57_9CORY|nr:DUF3367 domain-containing protein [Corynebacterium deserti]ALC06909.1 hypothetical protein CDES_12825 [Corynebacterium deserti GIMN1.010]